MKLKAVMFLVNPEGRALAKQSCQDAGLDFDEFESLVQAQVDNVGNARRRQLFATFDDILDRIKQDEE